MSGDNNAAAMGKPGNFVAPQAAAQAKHPIVNGVIKVFSGGSFNVRDEEDGVLERFPYFRAREFADYLTKLNEFLSEAGLQDNSGNTLLTVLNDGKIRVRDKHGEPAILPSHLASGFSSGDITIAQILSYVSFPAVSQGQER